MVIKQFFRKDRRYWYKLLIVGGKFHIIYDYREGSIGGRMPITSYNKVYSYETIDEALIVFNAWREKYE
jgi:hypothetical protein